MQNLQILPKKKKKKKKESKKERKENILQKISLKVFIIKLLIVVIDHPHGLMSVLFFLMLVPMNF